jgi:dTDP-4-amino-4,6-dideoxygalactose transaminase
MSKTNTAQPVNKLEMPIGKIEMPEGKIEMVDLKRQYARLKPEINAAMAEVLAETAFINGPQVKLFAAELAAYLGAAQVVPCANGTDALQLVLMALGLQPGDEVLVPAFNYVATAEVIALLKLKPVFVEADPTFFTLDMASARAAITHRTKAIMPVHLFGQCAPMQEVMDLASEFGLAVIEDNAQAIGAKSFVNGQWQVAGLIGTAGTTSFFPSKNLGCMGDGGAVLVNDLELGESIRILANHGQRKKYSYDIIGCNSRLDTLQAALLRVKLRYLDGFTATRQQAANWYDENLQGLEGLHTPSRATHSTHVFHQYTLRVEGGRRDALQTKLAEAGIPSMIYYPKPLHVQGAFGYLGQGEGSFPVAERLSKEVLSLPIHSEITEAEVAFISDTIRRIWLTL